MDARARICSQCGAPLKSADGVCGYCGTAFSAGEGSFRLMLISTGGHPRLLLSCLENMAAGLHYTRTDGIAGAIGGLVRDGKNFIITEPVLLLETTRRAEAERFQRMIEDNGGSSVIV